MIFERTAVAAASLLIAFCAQAGVDPATLPLEKLSADVIVVGAGGTGMAAAASAAENGAKVIVLRTCGRRHRCGRLQRPEASR